MQSQHPCLLSGHCCSPRSLLSGSFDIRGRPVKLRRGRPYRHRRGRGCRGVDLRAYNPIPNLMWMKEWHMVRVRAVKERPKSWQPAPAKTLAANIQNDNTPPLDPLNPSDSRPPLIPNPASGSAASAPTFWFARLSGIVALVCCADVGEERFRRGESGSSYNSIGDFKMDLMSSTHFQIGTAV